MCQKYLTSDCVRTGVVVVHLSKALIDEHLHKESPPAGLRNVPLCDPVARCWLKRLILVRIAFFKSADMIV